VRKWRARLIVVVLLAAAFLLYLRISGDRATDSTHISLGTVTLTAQAIPVETSRPGQVTTVSVAAQQRVTAGQRLGTVQVTSTDSNGEPVLSIVTLTAPRAGVVVDEPVTMGSTLQPGQAFVRLYDPDRLTFVTDVPLKTLAQISPGMSVALKADGLPGTVRATVQRVVPHVVAAGVNDEVAPGSLRMVLVPAKGQNVLGLVPGLRFTGIVDTASGDGSPRLISRN
jgi:multidrug resistance efflux pump